MDLKFFDKKNSLRLVYVLGAIVIALLLFRAGEFVGYNKAQTAYDWGQEYFGIFGHDNDVASHGGPFAMLPHDSFAAAHGAVGKVVKLALPSIVIEDQSGVEKGIVTTDDTQVRELRNSIQVTQIAVGDNIIVFGTPDTSGQVEATLIRVFPAGVSPIPGGNVPMIPATSTQKQ